MKDIGFALIFVASNLASLCLTSFVALQVWSRWQVDSNAQSRSLQGECCTCVCNGLASNCNRRVNEIMYGGVHNAMSTRDDGFFAPSHFQSLEKSLNEGFRSFMLDSCDCSGSATLCHSFCFSGTRDPGDVFSNVENFLNTYKNDVIILEFQMTAKNIFQLWEDTSDSFRNLVYKHPSKSAPWPTLNELRALGQRVLVFQHDGPDCEIEGNCPEGVMTTYNYVFETSFELDGAGEVLDFDSSCQRTRGPADAPFMLNNHWAGGGLFGLPDDGVSRDINTANVLSARLDACEQMLGKRTNFLMVDFWSIGDVMQVVNTYNAALPAAATRDVPAPTRDVFRRDVYDEKTP